MLFRSEKNLGMFCGILAFVVWGLFPMLFKPLNEIPPTIILTFRIIFSMFFLMIFIYFKNGFKSVSIYAKRRNTVFKLFCSGTFLCINWGLFIYAVNSNNILEANLGALVAPVCIVIFGSLFYKEKIDKICFITIILISIAIFIQTIGLGKFPLVALGLAISFTIYTMIKKSVEIPTFEGLFIETSCTFILALIYLFYLLFYNKIQINLNYYQILFLMFGGFMTILPLATFAIAARTLSASVIGFIQYICPIVEMLLALFVYHEKLSTPKAISFSIIWIGLLFYSFANLARSKKWI